jgi:hypothetical protein
MNVKSMCSFAGLLGAGVAIATVAIALVGAAAPSDAQQATTKDQFVGTWKVDVLKTTVGDKVSHPLGDRPSGYGLPPEKWSSLMYGLWPDGGLKNGKEATHCGRDRHEAAAG